MKSVIQGLGGPRGWKDPEGPGGLEGSEGSKGLVNLGGRKFLGSLQKSNFD